MRRGALTVIAAVAALVITAAVGCVVVNKKKTNDANDAEPEKGEPVATKAAKPPEPEADPGEAAPEKGGAAPEEGATRRVVGKDACEVDEDCVPAECCHPKTCVAAEHAPDCKDMMCTMDCRGGTMDCGGGKCVCHEGRCTAEIYPPRKSPIVSDPPIPAQPLVKPE